MKNPVPQFQMPDVPDFDEVADEFLRVYAHAGLHAALRHMNDPALNAFLDFVPPGIAHD